MLSNELKKGDKVVMAGTNWPATIADNARGNIRMAEVQGFYTETGSVYVWDIGRVVERGGVACDETIELTPNQIKARASVEGFLSGLR